MSQFDDDSTRLADGLPIRGRRMLTSFMASTSCADSNRRGDIMMIFSAPWCRGGSGPANDLCHGIVSVKSARLGLEPNCSPILLKSGGSIAIQPAMIPSASSTTALIDTALRGDVLASASSYTCAVDLQCPVY